MKSTLQSMVVLFVVSVSLTALSDGSRGGGLIGNGGPISFKNLILGVKGSAPSSWDSFDFGQILSFTSPKEDDNHEKLVLTIKESDLEPAESEYELYRTLTRQNPEKQWRKTSLNGSVGFEHLEGKHHTVVLIMPSPQSPLIISYDDEDGPFQQQLYGILSSLSIN